MATPTIDLSAKGEMKWSELKLTREMFDWLEWVRR